MENISISFSYPWLLLLLIPAILLAIIPYFTLNKRYRRNRNRITSIILHTIVMVLAIMLLAGMQFNYSLKNTTNEIIILVDLSDSEEYSEEDRDKFVRNIIDESVYDGYSVGVVTFGFDQVYAVPLTKEIETIYDTYLSAPKPDVTSTNIAQAIRYTAELFNNPDTGKIVLITDGKETEEDLNTAIKYVTAQNTRLDVAYVPAGFYGNDIQFLGCELPEYRITQNEPVTLKLTFNSSYSATSEITLVDNKVVDDTYGKLTINLEPGINTVEFTHVFKTEGIHKMDFEVVTNGDGIKENNKFSTFFNLQLYNNVLLVSRSDATMDEAAFLYEELTRDNKYQVTNTYIGAEGFPQTIDELREYDQVILNNIANADMEESFVDILYSYVYDFGGGLLTVGGSDGEELNSEGQMIPIPHAYDRSDMYGTKYQDMLPVQAINYTPPVGVMGLIDISGSMSADDGTGDTRLTWARIGLAASMEALTERDYLGIIAMESSHHMVLPMTPLPQQSKIKAAINTLQDTRGGTLYCDAYTAACQQLAGNPNVERRHIIMLTDGLISAGEQQTFEQLVYENYQEHGITLSIVIIGTDTKPTAFANQLINGEVTVVPGELTESSSAYDSLLRAIWLGNDVEAVPDSPELTVKKRQEVVDKLHLISSGASIATELRKDLLSSSIKEIELKSFQPTIHNIMSPLLNGVRDEEDNDFDKIPVSLAGFYGVKVRASADLILKGDYNEPIYAQWKFGKGMVGSFMIDLHGQLSSDFIASDRGKRFVLNVVENISATSDIRANNIDYTLIEDNYLNQLNVMVSLEEGESITGEITWDGGSISLSDTTKTNDDIFVTTPFEAKNNYSRCNFVIKNSGNYTITLKKLDANGQVVETTSFEKAFSYSKEYDQTDQTTEESVVTKLENLAQTANGAYIDDINNVGKIFETFITDIHRSYDPRVLFIIIIIVLFLLDIAVRKFKFKWLHEIIRDRKDSRFKNHK